MYRTTNRSAPPSNRPVASVPMKNMSSMPAPTPNPMAPPPATTQQQQYGHAPHLRQGSASSSQPPPHRQPSSSSRSSSNAVGMPPPNTHMHNAVPVDKRPASRSLSNSGSQNLTDKEKKEKERFLMFTRVLMKWVHDIWSLWGYSYPWWMVLSNNPFCSSSQGTSSNVMLTCIQKPRHKLKNATKGTKLEIQRSNHSQVVWNNVFVQLWGTNIGRRLMIT